MSEDPLPNSMDPSGKADPARTPRRPPSEADPSRPESDTFPPLEVRSGRAWVVVGSILILAAALLPYLLAVFRTEPGVHFWGAIWYAPDDSLLLSVIREGQQGRWLHTPPYATATGPGAFFYPVYLLLGHLCAWTGLAPLHAFHLGRLAAAALLLASLWRFVGRCFPALPERRFAYFVAATGGGLGWLLLLGFGFRSPELSASEAYPFFAMDASLHLALAIAAMLWVLDALVPREAAGAPARWRRGATGWAAFVVGALVLATLQPFGIVVAFAVGALWATASWLRERRPPLTELLALAALTVLSAPFVLHQLTTIATNPAYLGWRTQVRTPTPPWWQVLAGVGLALPFALTGLVDALRRRRPTDLLLVFWTGSMAVLMALPYYQARRFDVAGYVPLAILAVRGLRVMRLDLSGSPRLLAGLANALTSLLILGTSVARIVAADPELFVRRDTWDAIRWLGERAPVGSVVLARPTTSLVVLASTPLRVVHGHAAETPHARESLRAVKGFFEQGHALDDELATRVDYILVEPSASPGRALPLPAGFTENFRAGGVAVYARDPARRGRNGKDRSSR